MHSQHEIILVEVTRIIKLRHLITGASPNSQHNLAQPRCQDCKPQHTSHHLGTCLEQLLLDPLTSNHRTQTLRTDHWLC